MTSSYSITYSQEADNILSKLNEKDREKIIKRIDKLRKFPDHFAYPLTGTRLWSLRVGDYRILLRLDKKERRIFIVTLGHRKRIYRRRL